MDYELVTPGDTDDNSIYPSFIPSFSFSLILLELLNAKYAISLARKLGCCVFLLPEDIVEVKAKLILTFVGTLMSVDS